MLLQVYKGWGYDWESKSPKLGIDGKLPSPCVKVVLITASKNHQLLTWSYKFSNSEISTETQTVENHEFMGSAQHRPLDQYSTQLVKTT